MAVYKQKEWLISEYVTKDKSSKLIAEEVGVSQQTIMNWVERLGIPKRHANVRTAKFKKREHPTDCVNCGKTFYVDMPSKADPLNKGKHIRACSDECTSALMSANMKRTISQEGFKWATGHRTLLDRDELIQLICYEYKFLGEVAEILGVKSTTLSREIKRLNVPLEFYRICPQCEEQFASSMRCQVDETSNKFRKFCGHPCFLKSRRNTDTWIERATEEFLRESGIKFVKQYEIGRMTADFYVPDINLIIETNGDFWHANPVVYPNKDELHPIQQRAIIRDEIKMRRLTEKGYDVFVVWEYELTHEKDAVHSRMLRHILTKYGEEVTN